MSRTCFSIVNFAGTQLCPKASHPQSCTNMGVARNTHPTLDLRDIGRPLQLLLPHLKSSITISNHSFDTLSTSTRITRSAGGVRKPCVCFPLFGSVSHPENIKIYQLFLFCLYTCTPHTCSYNIEGIDHACERSFPLPPPRLPALPSIATLDCVSTLHIPAPQGLCY